MKSRMSAREEFFQKLMEEREESTNRGFKAAAFGILVGLFVFFVCLVGMTASVRP